MTTKNWRKDGVEYTVMAKPDGEFVIVKYGVDDYSNEYIEEEVISLGSYQQAKQYMSWLDSRGENVEDRWSFDDAEAEIRNIEREAALVAGIWRKWYAVKFRGFGPSTLEAIWQKAKEFLSWVSLAEDEIRRGFYESNSFEVDLLMELKDVAGEAVHAAAAILDVYQQASGRSLDIDWPHMDYHISDWKKLPHDLFDLPEVVWYPPDPPMPEPPELPAVVLEVVEVQGDKAQVGIADMFGATVFATVDIDEPVEVGHAVVIRARKFSRKAKALVDAVYDGFADQQGDIATLVEVESLKYTYDEDDAKLMHESACFKFQKEWERLRYGAKPTREELDAAEAKVFGKKTKSSAKGWDEYGHEKKKTVCYRDEEDGWVLYEEE